MFIQYYISQCCKIAMSTVNRGGVYIDDSFTVDIESFFFFLFAKSGHPNTHHTLKYIFRVFLSVIMNHVA